VPGALAFSLSEKAETDSLEAQYLPVEGQWHPAVLKNFGVAMSAYDYGPGSEMTSHPSEVLQPMKGLKFGKASGSNCIPRKFLTTIYRLFSLPLYLPSARSVYKSNRFPICDE
jgi:hypothetical protein